MKKVVLALAVVGAMSAPASAADGMGGAGGTWTWVPALGAFVLVLASTKGS